MRIGIFGGTFDPPHLGHLILAAEAGHQLRLDRLLFVLTPQPPHKGGRLIAPLDARLEMLGAAIADNPSFALSRVEIERPGPHYSADTVHLVRAEYPDSTLAFLMGGDSLRDLPSWRRADDFVAACDVLGVMRRPYQRFDLKALEEKLPGIGEKVQFIRAPLLEISSRQIRRRIAEGRPYLYYLPAAVAAVIARRGLYRQAE
jgi:nicotinate-nucleotide adenylyltransferase